MLPESSQPGVSKQETDLPSEAVVEVRADVKQEVTTSESAPAEEGSKEKSGAESAGTPYPQKYWWVVLVLVPVVVALIPIMFKSGEKGSGKSGELTRASMTISIPGFPGNMSLAAISGTNVTVNQTIQNISQLIENHDYQQAIPLLHQVADQAPSASVYNNLAVLYASADQPQSARIAYDQALQQDPNDKSAHYNLGLLEQKEGRLEEARDQFKLASGFSDADQRVTQLERQLDQSAVRATAPHSDLEHALAVPVNRRISGSIATGSSTDWYRFTTPDRYRDMIEFSVVNLSTSLVPAFTLKGEDKADIASPYQSTAGADLTYSFASDPGKTYYLEVYGVNGSAGAYKLIVKTMKAYDQYEPNDDVMHATPIDLGTTLSANIMDSHDVDFYRFTSPVKGGKIDARVQNLSTSLVPAFTLKGEDKADIASPYQNTAGADLTYSFASDPGKTYYLEVYGGGGSAGAYKLTVKPE